MHPMQLVILGLLVAFASFGVMQFVVLKYFRRFTLPALLVAVGFGLGLALIFPEPGRALYQMGWMLAMASSVAMFALGSFLRGRSNNKR